jgi:hypothetical protein
MELECVDGRLFQMEAQHPALFCSAAGGNAVLAARETEGNDGESEAPALSAMRANPLDVLRAV